MKKFLCGVAACSLLVLQTAAKGADVQSYRSYVYNAWGEAVASPHGYLPEKTMYGEDFGCGPLSQPSDLYIDDKGNVYIADSGNNRILCLNSEWKLVREIKDVLDPYGIPDKLKYPTGVFCDDEGYIYVADRENYRAVRINSENVIDLIYEKPDSLKEDSLVFKPVKILADSSGWAYILVDGMYRGAMLYDTDANFTGFFGSNTVEVTPIVLAERFARMFMTDAQKKKQLRIIPVGYTNFDINDKDFIYTCSSAMSTSSSTATIKKNNYLGSNIYVAPAESTKAISNKFGDLEAVWDKGSRIDTSFKDLVVDDKGFVTALDATRGRIFQYDKSTNLTFVFGGIGNNLGTFVLPVAVECYEDKIYVLDQEKSSVTVFEPTFLGSLVRSALVNFNAGQYVESLDQWREVLKISSNYELAYVGIGKAYYQLGKYDEAMYYFEQGNDPRSRSLAFERWRSGFINSNIGWIVLGLFAVAFLAAFIKRLLKRRVSK